MRTPPRYDVDTMSRDADATGTPEFRRLRTARGRRRKTLISSIIVLMMMGGFAWALAGQWSEVAAALRTQSAAIVLASLLAAMTGTWVSFEIWRGTLGVLGNPIPRTSGSSLFFTSQLGKYLPGSVWPVLAQMRWGRALGIPQRHMALAFLLTLGLSVALGLLLGLPVIPVVLRYAPELPPLTVLAVIPLLLVLLVPGVVNGLLGLLLRALRRPALEKPLRARDLGRGVVWGLVFWLVYGGHVWLLAVGAGADPLAAVVPAVGGFALAFSLGPLLVVFPAGAGVREAVLTMALATVVTTPQAAAIALSSRGLLLATDGLLALATTAARGRAERAAAAPEAC